MDGATATVNSSVRNAWGNGAVAAAEAEDMGIEKDGDSEEVIFLVKFNYIIGKHKGWHWEARLIEFVHYTITDIIKLQNYKILHPYLIRRFYV